MSPATTHSPETGRRRFLKAVAAIAAASGCLPHEVPWSEAEEKLKEMGQRAS